MSPAARGPDFEYPIPKVIENVSVPDPDESLSWALITKLVSRPFAVPVPLNVAVFRLKLTEVISDVQNVMFIA